MITTAPGITMKTAFDLAFRLGVLLLSLALGAFILAAGAQMALAANVRSLVTLNDSVLRAGDIFDGVDGEKAARILGPAPQPGSDMVLNANTLLRVALALNIAWQPSSSTEQVVIRRAATVINDAAIRDTLAQRLKTEGGVDGKFDVIFSSIAAPQMILPSDQPASLDIESFRFDPQTNRFEAALAAPSRETPAARLTVTGTVQRYVSVPITRRTLRAGDIIGGRDIILSDVPMQNVQPGTILDEEKLSGLTPRRMIEAGKPVRDMDVESPQLVGRGDFVMLVYHSGPITLTAKGKSLQDGAAGDVVKILNIASNRTLEGIVSADREVTVLE